MHDDNEYLQNILLKKSKNNHFINIKSRHAFLLQHAMKNLQSMIGISFYFLILKKLKTRYMMMWHVNLRHITLGVHNVHVNFLKLQFTQCNMSLPKTTKKYFTKYVLINQFVFSKLHISELCPISLKTQWIWVVEKPKISSCVSRHHK